MKKTVLVFLLALCSLIAQPVLARTDDPPASKSRPAESATTWVEAVDSKTRRRSSSTVI
jgi:hypothetical protein